ncbi:hypothetical protein [Flavobacterium sp.]|jgi:hypothetical protein|uniref:hypothetical protein n=1 Tax=Flavobacterium sp. TaxID=239 RepID=UPI0037C0E310
MKKNILILILFISFSSYGKTETDTINNWQLYKDNKIIFKSNEVENDNQTILIKGDDNFKLLKFDMFYDFFGDKTLKRMEFIVDDKIIQTFSVENPARNSFIFYKNELSELISKYSNKIIHLKYYDKIYPNGIFVCNIKFIKNVNN